MRDADFTSYPLDLLDQLATKSHESVHGLDIDVLNITVIGVPAVSDRGVLILNPDRLLLNFH